MEFIGENVDGSGSYRMYLDGDALVTQSSNGGGEFWELARQGLSPAPDFVADSEDDWYEYGVAGHQCDVHYEAPYARIDGTVYALGPDQDVEAGDTAGPHAS